MERRHSKTLVALLALTMGGALTLAGCGAPEEPQVEPSSTAAEETSTPEPEEPAETPEPEPAETSEPEPEPEPVVPAWEDIAGTWCSGELGCITIDPGLSTGSWESTPATIESKTERDGCFSFYLIYGGGTAFTACMAGTPSPGVGTNGAPLGEGDESQDRIYPDAQAGSAPETMYRQ